MKSWVAALCRAARKGSVAWGLAWVAVVAGAEPMPPVVLLVESSAFMPQARVDGARVVDGLHLEVAQALARRWGRELVARPVPRKRLAEALQRGEGDLACDYQPEWLPGAFAWSRPFLPDQALLVTAAEVPAPAHWAALAGQPIGTVRGYVYPEVGDALRGRFQRDDAPDALTNLQKLARGRVQHALTGRRVLEYLQRTGQFQRPLHPPWVVSEVLAQCALSPSSSVNLASLNAAIHALVSEGELSRLLAHYR